MSAKTRRALGSLRSYAVFFLLTAFIITCCMELFLKALQHSTGLEFNEQNLRSAAVLTFVNVIFLSFLFTVIDILQRKFTVERPVQRIIEGGERIMHGDFSVRIEPLRGASFDGFDRIIDCFNRMAEELSGVETLRTDFIANVSHKLKTPLAVMQNYATLLQNPNISDEQRTQYAKAITQQLHRLADLITNILKLNRLENQRIFPTAKRFNLGGSTCRVSFKF